jgi:ribose transport system permease protein
MIERIRLNRKRRGLSKIPGILYLTILFFIIFIIFSKEFISLGNIFDIIRQGSVLIIVSLGMLIVIIGGGIDLSVGALLGLTGTIIAYLLQRGFGLAIAITASIIACGVSGLVSGLFISKGRIFPFIATFGMLFMVQGVSLGITQGGSIHITNGTLIQFGSGNFLGAPPALWITLSVAILIALILRKTIFGFYSYAIGNDTESARSIGIRVDLYVIIGYVLSGVLASIAGVILASRVNTGSALIGIGAEFKAIAAVAIGGTPLTGGRGNVIGTILGALVITILSNGLTLMGFTPELTAVITGLSIMVAVVCAQLLYRERGTKK